jgi:hypothetical protein
MGLIGVWFIAAQGSAGRQPVDSASASDDEARLACSSADIQSISASREFFSGLLQDGTPTLKLDSNPARATPATPPEAQTVYALGPVLGSMDSPEVTTDVACTPNGVEVTANVTRSAEYDGAVAKNVAWRPRLEVVLVLHAPQIVFESTWKMMLSTGTGVTSAETPPYPDQSYPTTVSTIVP